jgi:hypothetical protein
MLPNFNSKNYFIAIILLVIFAVGCSPASPSSASPSSTSSSILSPTWTSTITATPTIILTPTQTITLTSIPTITPTLPASLTPLPTIPFDELSFKFEVLLATNGDCHLPCFWGMTPGETTIAELKNFSSQFSNGEYIPLQLRSDGAYTFYYFTNKSGDSTFTTLFFVDDEKIEAMGIKMETAMYSFPLSKLLSDYGIPEKVFISPDQHEEILYMIVLYESQHIAGKYVLIRNKLDSSLYCYNPLSIDQYIVAWAPGKNWLDYLNREFRSSTDVISKDSLKPLKDVSDYDIPSLQRTLKTPNRSLCIKVEIDKIHP